MDLVVNERKSTLDESRWSNALDEVEAWWRRRCPESEPFFDCEVVVDADADESDDDEDESDDDEDEQPGGCKEQNKTGWGVPE